jgi:hypothetical protein
MRLIPPFPQGKHCINRGFQPTGGGETLRPTEDSRRFQPTG